MSQELYTEGPEYAFWMMFLTVCLYRKSRWNCLGALLPGVIRGLSALRRLIGPPWLRGSGSTTRVTIWGGGSSCDRGAKS